MIKEIGMPKFGLSMETGTIAAWLVKEGDAVTQGQALAEINSEKLTNVCESPADGVVRKIVAQVDEELACGETICIIADSMTEEIPSVAAAAPAAPAVESASAAPAAAPVAAPAASSVKITPKAKKYAEEHGLAYDHIVGTGVGGAITIDDVKKNGKSAAAAAAAPAVPRADVKITPKAKKYAEEHGLAYDHIVGTGIGGAITIDDVKKNGKSAAATAAPAAPAAPVAYEEPADVKITRRAKAVALRKGWAYGHIAGSGEGGTITISDLKRYGKPYGEVAAAAVSAYDSTKPDEIRKMTPMQQAVCKGMMTSLMGTAQTTIAAEVDISSLVRLYKSIKDKYTAAGIKLSYTAMIIKAVAMAMENHPDMRVSPVDDKNVRIAESIDIGCAVDVPGGLIVPVIRGANMKDLRTICLELFDLTEKAKAGKLTAENLGGACITITNLGMFGITYFTPVLNAPESLILGIGTILQQVIARNGVMTPASIMNMSLTHDHRVINGAPAARFLQEVVAGLTDFKWL